MFLLRCGFFVRSPQHFDASKEKYVEHKKVIGGVRRSGIIEVAIQNLVSIAKNWESEERKSTRYDVLEVILMGTALVFSGVIRGNGFPMIDEEDAAKILATIYEVSKMFHFERDTERPFPTFIFVDSLWLLTLSFPTLSFPNVGVHLLRADIPQQKMGFKAVQLSDTFLHEILGRGPWDRGFETIGDFILKHDPSAFPVAPERQGRFSFRTTVRQLARWAVANVERIKADYAEDPNPDICVKLPLWCLKALNAHTRDVSPEIFIGQVWVLVCIVSLCPCDDEFLAKHKASGLLFANLPWSGWIAMADVCEVDRKLSEIALRRILDIASLENVSFNADIDKWIITFLLAPGSEHAGAFFAGIPNVFEHRDPESVLLRRALKFPKAFANALLGYHISPSSTKIHHIMSFALMCQIDVYTRSTREPFISQFVEALREQGDTEEKVERQ